MPLPGQLHHVELYVSNLQRSEAFWGWFLESLGYQLFQSWEKGRSWKLGETYIVFVQVEERFTYPSYHRCRVGLNHLAFHAESREQVDDLLEQLKARGITILYSDLHPHNSNPYAIFFEDPDRIKVELVAPE
jgi:catechol 2,3-dioxygenase-like lactoylglutathione lyase family enzyme